MKKKVLEITVRWMCRKDMKDVLRIERESFDEHAWSEEQFMACLQNRNCIGMVAEYQGKVVGFMIFETQKTKILLRTVATLSKFRRKGVASQMIDKLKKRLGRQRCNQIMLEVRETNLPAQLFLRSLGFRATDILHGFFVENDEDAYRMVYKHAS